MNDKPERSPLLKAELSATIMTTDKPRVINVRFECVNSAAIFKQMFTGAVMYRAGDEGVILPPGFFSEKMLDDMWNLLMSELEAEEIERLIGEVEQSGG